MKTRAVKIMVSGAVLLVLAACQTVNLPPGPQVDQAVAVLAPLGESGVHGVVTFQKTDNDLVAIQARVHGLSPGKHGFHVHTFGDGRSLEDGQSAGGHFNPENMPHGAPRDAERHVGDLGNVVADSAGNAILILKDDVLRLNGPHSVLGRAVIVHAAADDLHSQPTGAAGARVAWGVIGIANPEIPLDPAEQAEE